MSKLDCGRSVEDAPAGIVKKGRERSATKDTRFPGRKDTPGRVLGAGCGKGKGCVNGAGWSTQWVWPRSHPANKPDISVVPAAV